MFACTADREVVDHRAQGLEDSRSVSSQVRGMGSCARRLIGLHHWTAQHMLLQGVHQRLQPHSAGPAQAARLERGMAPSRPKIAS